jgi:hypothetical protein
MNSFLRKVFSHKHLFRTLFTGFLLIATIGVWGQTNINAGSTNYTQDFNSLASSGSGITWTNNTTLTGWYAATDATASISTYDINTGTTTTGGLYSFGIAGTNVITERALGYAASNAFFGTAGTQKGYLGWRLKNNTTSTISSITITWTGEQWRRDNTVNQTLLLSYQTGTTVTSLTTGTWTSAGSTFTSPQIVGGAAALDGNTAANRTANISVTITVSIPSGSEIMLRWEDLNDSGNDHQLALDDVTVNAVVTPLSTNIPSDPGVNWVGANQNPTGYTQPINCSGTSPFVFKYRRIATTTAQPTDGRGQWATTIYSQASGDVYNWNMNGNPQGILFTSDGTCGSQGGWNRKWAFTTSGNSANNDAVNAITYMTSGGADMGLNMSTSGYYTFVLRDVGYANSDFYVGYTAATPVSLSHSTSSQVTLNGDYTTTIQATLSTTPSAQESFYVRYRVGTNDFSTGTSITTAGTVSGTTVTFTIPSQSVGSTIYYYIFSTTVPYATINGYSEQNKSLSALAVADNSNANYSFTIPATTTYTWAGGATGAWTTSSNWSPVGVPGNGDAVVFNNSTSVTVTAIPSVNLRSITMTSTGAVVWQASGSRTINVGFTGATNPVLSVPSGKQFNFTGTANDIVLNIKSGYTATIAGSITFSGSGSVAHRLTGEATSAITFQNGSIFTAGTNFSGNAFGDVGVTNTVIFESGSIYDYFAGANPFGLNNPDSKVVFQSGSLYRHNTTSFPSFSGRTYANVQIMSGAGTSLNNLTGSSGFTVNNLILETGVTLGLNLSGSHSIKGDITIASGATLNFAPSSTGTVNFNGSSEQYVTVNGTGSITTGANATLSVAANSTLNFVGESYAGGSGTFVLQSNSAIGIGSASGITTAGTNAGNVRTATRTFISDATYIYNGAYNQVTGTGLPTTISESIKIANTGSAGNNTVTLTNTNLTATTLYLNQGLFAAGTNQNLNIAHNGQIYGNGGSTTSDASAGSITFIGTGTTYGITQTNPSLYYVILKNNGGIDYSGVSFNGTGSASATIMNSLRLDNGSYITQAPYYQSGSTLIYNTGGTYGRNVEWGSASNQGYPHHVTVQGNTTVNLFSNPIAPDELSIGGDLTLGNSNGYGRVNLNNGMTKPLSVGGSLIIGTTSVTSQNSQLNLSSGNGGDLWLDGDFTRYPNGEYNDNSRAIFFKGNSDSYINTPNVTISAGEPTQYFSYLLMQKTTSTADVTLNCPVGIYNQLTLNSGTITSTNTNLLVMVDNSTVSGGSDASFVNGPMKKIGNDAFVFPVGKLFATNPLSGSSVGGHHIIGISAPSGTSEEFIAEYYLGNANLIGPITASGLVRVSACEYWRLERNGSSNVHVTLSWNSRSNCNVGYVTDLSTLVVAHNSATTTGGAAPFTGGNWDSYGRNSTTGTTGPTGAGTITWNNVTTFSPFALGSTDQNDNPLPFNLNRFNATPAKKNILLDWAVGNNHEQQSYTLERSKDGIHFEAITHVAALKDVTVAEYTYADEQPLTGWNYYRLRATDNLLRQATSRIIRIWWGQGPAVISVLPNPASEKIVINLSDPSSITEIQIVNSTGQVVKQTRSVQFSNEVHISSLQAGMYYIRLFGKNGLTTKSFVKQ